MDQGQGLGSSQAGEPHHKEQPIFVYLGEDKYTPPHKRKDESWTMHHNFNNGKQMAIQVIVVISPNMQLGMYGYIPHSLRETSLRF